MQIQKLTKIDEYKIRIEPGEKLMASLEKIMRDSPEIGYINFEIFTGGGFIDIECYFSEKLEKGGSVEHKLAGPMELGGAGGNIAWIRNNPNEPNNPKTHVPAVHCHVCLGDKDGLKGYVAHLKEATVKLTAEVKIEVYKEKIFRKLDEKLGLMLLDLPAYSPIKLNQPTDKGEIKDPNSELKDKLKRVKERVKTLKEKVSSNFIGDKDEKDGSESEEEAVGGIGLAPGGNREVWEVEMLGKRVTQLEGEFEEWLKKGNRHDMKALKRLRVIIPRLEKDIKEVEDKLGHSTNESGGNLNQPGKDKIKELETKIKDLETQNRKLREQNTEINRTNADLLKKLTQAQTQVPPKQE